MRPYLASLHTTAKIAFILGLSLASCKGGPTSPSAPTFALSVNSLTVTSTEPPRVIAITNLGSEQLDWRILSSTASWLTASPGQGAIEPHGEEVLQVRIDPRAVPKGTHAASLQIGAAGYSAKLNVTVQEPSAPRAEIKPGTLTIGGSQTSATFEISNPGGSALEWSLSTPSWLTVNPDHGDIPAGGRTQVVVTPDRSSIGGGSQEAILQLTSNGGAPSAKVMVEALGIPGLRIDPGSLNFGSSNSQLSFRLINESNQSISWSAQPGAS